MSTFSLALVQRTRALRTEKSTATSALRLFGDRLWVRGRERGSPRWASYGPASNREHSLTFEVKKREGSAEALPSDR